MSGRPKATWCCPECGSDEIELPVWINVNTDAVVASDENALHWCPHCEMRFRAICHVTLAGQCLIHKRPFASCRSE